MRAKLKSGKIITGRLAETFTKIGLSKEVKAGRPKKENVNTNIPVNVKKTVKKKPGKKKK
jgi:hypothetical protein